MNNLRRLVVIVCFSISAIASADETLSVFDNQYKAKLYGFSIDVRSRLTPSPDGSYELYFKADSLIGSVTETSSLNWDATTQIVKPRHYTYKRSSLAKSREEELNFDWAKRIVSNPLNNTNWAMTGNHDIQDDLSYQLQLRQDLLAGKKKFIYHISNGKKIKEYYFEVVDEETLDTPLGDVQTVKVKRSYTNDARATYAWFAKDYQYLLIRLQQEENDSIYTININKASLNGKAIKHF
jgi:hypothetical protein